MLAIDAGNSNLALARFDNGAIATRQTILREEIAARRLATALDALGPASQAILCSVVPGVTSLLVEAVAVTIGGLPHQLSHTSPHGLRFAVPEPATAGADRIAAACGALTHVPPPLIVVDCGTATTVTLIDHDTDGAPLYCGGAIAPGGGTALAALRERAPHLPEPAAAPLPAVGNTSATAMAIGALAGHAAMIDGLVDRLAASLAPDYGPEAVPIFITGGWAPRCLPHLRHRHTYEPDLVLHGLAAIASHL